MEGRTPFVVPPRTVTKGCRERGSDWDREGVHRGHTTPYPGQRSLNTQVVREELAAKRKEQSQ